MNVAIKDSEGFWVLARPDADLEARMDRTYVRAQEDPPMWHDMLLGHVQNSNPPNYRKEDPLRFDEATRTLWLPAPHASLEKRLDEDYERVPGQLRWKVKDDGFTFARALDFIKSKASGNLDVGDPVVKQRVASCTPCDALKRGSDGAYCQTCGCGAKVMMLMPDGSPAPKILLKRLNCPKYRKGFSNERA